MVMDQEEGAGAGRGEGMQAARELGNYNIMLIGPGKHQPLLATFVCRLERGSSI